MHELCANQARDAVGDAVAMTEDAPDTTTMSGAEFHRHAGTDPQKWAEAFIAAYA